FVRDLITEWRRLDLPFADATVVIGVSGGADSVSLLLAMDELRSLKKLGLRLVAAHFNHRLRDGESDVDEEFVRALTNEREIEFAVGHAEMPEKGNLEQNARVERYAFLGRTAGNVNAFAVLTGHTVNDQAETFLMNLIRGSGIDGLCGMKPMRQLHDKAPAPADGCETDREDGAAPFLFPVSPLLVRPLLTWAKRGDTEQFCHDNGVLYRYDTMNEDTAFKRVRLRKILLPLLEDMNPNIVETLANTAALMQDSADGAAAGDRVAEPDELTLGDVKELPRPELYVRLRTWLRHHRGNTRRLELKHIQAIERLILSGKSGKVAELPGGKVTKSAGKIVYKENKVEN
ncbi:MAG: tRNA lysidine(34) synthetase TilS, partial [Pyrinomonadaceae bacterium]